MGNLCKISLNNLNGNHVNGQENGGKPKLLDSFRIGEIIGDEMMYY